MVSKGKGSSGSIHELVGYVLLCVAGEAIERQTLVTGGLVRLLVVKAIGGIIP